MNFYDLANRLTLNLFDSSSRQKQIDSYNEQNNLRANLAMLHQFDYDSWAKQFSQEQFAYQKQMDDKQYQLASQPISTLLNDAAKNGISPMAALGQNVGSVSAGSVGVPSSSVQNAQMSVPQGSGSSLGSALSLLSSVALEKKRLAQQDKQFNQNLKFQYQKMEQDNLLRRDLGSARAALDALDLNYFIETGTSRQEHPFFRSLKELFSNLSPDGKIPDSEQIESLDDDEKKSLREVVESFINSKQEKFESWLDSHPKLRKAVDSSRKFLKRGKNK